MKELEELIRRLDRIAKANKDNFQYTIEVEALRPAGIRVQFAAKETADWHSILSGMGTTLEEAVKDASEGIEDSCKEWGYKVVK